MNKTQKHNTEVRGSLGITNNTEGLWWGSCSCGWVSTWQETEREAENEATDHVVAITRAGA